MLLQAEWKPDLQCFVKTVHHQPDESDGFVWPAPSFEFYDRQGVEITGRRKAQILKDPRNSIPKFIVPDYSKLNVGTFSHQIINNRIQGSFAREKTATEVFHKMEQSQKVLDAKVKEISDQMAKQLEDHMMDAMMYGMGPMTVEHHKDSIRIVGDRSMKIMRPEFGIFKVPDA